MTAHLFLFLELESYDQWKEVFDDKTPLRARHGVQQHDVHRGIDQTDRVVLQLRFPSAEAVRAFLDDAELKEAMKDAGVQGPPTVVLAEHVEQRAY